MKFVFDIGGTRTRIGMVRNPGNLDQVVDYETNQNWNEAMVKFVSQVKDLAQGEKIEGVAGGVAGVWDKEKTKLMRSPNLIGWIDQPTKERLMQDLGVEVKLDNDAALGGLGEAVYGAGQGQDISAYLALGTGVGGTKVVNGKIDSNACGFEPGHQLVNGQTLESLIGGRALLKKYNMQPSEIVDSKVWAEVNSYLADGIVNLVLLWSPNIVVLGGSVMKKIDIEILKDQVAKKIEIYPWLPRIERSKLGDEAGLWGAMTL